MTFDTNGWIASTTAMERRLGSERFHLVTTDPATRDGPSAEWRWHPVTDALVRECAACGIDRINEGNALETARRIATRSKDEGSLELYVQGRDTQTLHITFEDVWLHVGLETCLPKASLAEFKNRFGSLADPKFGLSAYERYEHVFAQHDPRFGENGSTGR